MTQRKQNGSWNVQEESITYKLLLGQVYCASLSLQLPCVIIATARLQYELRRALFTFSCSEEAITIMDKIVERSQARLLGASNPNSFEYLECVPAVTKDMWYGVQVAHPKILSCCFVFLQEEHQSRLTECLMIEEEESRPGMTRHLSVSSFSSTRTAPEGITMAVTMLIDWWQSGAI
jgi:hypothetical protein